MTFSTTRPHIQAGKLVPLAVSSPERLSDFPEIQTFNELGHPDLVATSWFSISGPARLPRSVVEKLNAAINKSMTLNSVRKHFEQEGVLTNSMSPEEFTLFVESQIKKWVPIVKASIAK
jgi:tripartite-type tricarboxylate transporter receptor subunit TctC